MTFWKILLLAAAGLGGAFTQTTVTSIELRADGGARVRPFESVALQVRVYGKAGSQEGRLRRDGAKIEVRGSNAGWVSKPFRFQGTDEEKFIDEYQSAAGQIFGQLSGRFVLQDAVLYTAPEKPGRYEVKAILNSISATLTMIVDRNAPSRRKAEQYNFGPEPPSLDPYRDLAEHWAPLFAQETWWTPKADYVARFDYDGDWRGDNNWDHLGEGTSQAYVHYAAMETPTHYFLIYNVFHPRDYSDKCVAGSCHENDNEGLILTIAKDGSAYGRLQVMETLAHNNVYSFVADERVRNGVHDIDGQIEFQGNRPVAFIESGGHGIYGTSSPHARYDVENDRFTAGTGVTYVYKGEAERPKCPNDRLVGYELLPIYYYWWARAYRDAPDSGKTFDEFFTYRPYGNRPAAYFSSIGGAFLGRAQASNKAKPFWGWHDNRTRKKKVLAVGQWGLDPAYAVAQDLRLPQPFSTDYVFNPYLRLNGSRQAGPLPPARTASPTSPRVATRTEGRGSGTLPQAPGGPPAAVAPQPQPEAAPSSGSFEIFVWVDGTTDAVVQGDQVSFQTLQGAPHRAWRDLPNQPMPKAPLSSLKLVVRQGRGKVRILEKPDAGNGYATRIRIEDKQRAGSLYHVILEWQR